MKKGPNRFHPVGPLIAYGRYVQRLNTQTQEPKKNDQMPMYQHFKPSEIREAAAQIWMKDYSTEDKEKAAEALGVSTTNLYSAVKLKDKENNDPETLRGIDACIRLLQHNGIPIEPVPLYAVRVVRAEPAAAEDMPEIN